MANGIIIIIGIALILIGLASVFLSIIPSITNAVEDVGEAVGEGTKDSAVKAGISIVWAMIIWYFTIGLTAGALVLGTVVMIIGFID